MAGSRPSLSAMPWLDCHDYEAALASLAEAIGATPSELGTALGEYEESRLENAAEDPWELMPREVLGRFHAGVETVADRFDGAYYFHGTRAIDPDAFRVRGILPLDQMVEELWATLRELAGNDVTDAEWHNLRSSVEGGAGGHSGTFYRMKTGGRIHHGPFAIVVRETFLDPASTGSHDYLGCPEIVQDIAACYASAHGGNLEQRFCAAAKPCIVKLRSTQLRPGAIAAALWYAYTKVRDGEITSSANYSFDGEGEPVPAGDVVGVEIVTRI
jgi:hypothetical protein